VQHDAGARHHASAAERAEEALDERDGVAVPIDGGEEHGVAVAEVAIRAPVIVAAALHMPGSRLARIHGILPR
jgi:hypothetical protein